MGIEATFWAAFVASLKADATLAAQIKTFADGQDFKTYQGQDTPALLMMGGPVLEEPETIGTRRISRMEIMLYGLIETHDPTTRMSAVYNLDEDIKNAVDAFITAQANQYTYELSTENITMLENNTTMMTIIKFAVKDNLVFTMGAR